MLGDRRLVASVFAGGVVGALARAAIADAIPYRGTGWPTATFLVNIAGAALLAWFTTRLQERLPLSAYRRPFLATGVCGAFTTFSTMQVELLRMLDTGQYWLAAAYALASLGLGFMTVFVVTAFTRRVRIRVPVRT